ncbi:MAG: hypothetical protein AVO35_04160 [Candidatus Aegiribacteria sp. MLS_C]|nr:MAG: hypothetical protein AVO35_04160 [Candidatus Aegiribacteria sp. MLS_C]
MKGLVIWIRTAGDSGEAVLDELGAEISGRGGRVEVFHGHAVENLGMEENSRAKAVACAMLASHGVVVIASGVDPSGLETGERFALREVSEQQLLDITYRNSFIRDLELSGLIPPPALDVHPDEEKEILKRLREMGYLDED